jgi:hypothetical protein
MFEDRKYSVPVSPKAREMLFEHAIFLSQVSMNRAYELFDLFEERVASLEIMPERCPQYVNPYIHSGKYRKLALGNYLLILFQVTDNTVHIELVIDSRADNDGIFL